MKTTEIFADTRKHAQCRGCHAPILFAQVVKSGKQMPFDLPLAAIDAMERDGRIVEVVDLDRSHFARCAAAWQFRRARA